MFLFEGFIASGRKQGRASRPIERTSIRGNRISGVLFVLREIYD